MKNIYLQELFAQNTLTEQEMRYKIRNVNTYIFYRWTTTWDYSFCKKSTGNFGDSIVEYVYM